MLKHNAIKPAPKLSSCESMITFITPAELCGNTYVSGVYRVRSGWGRGS